MAKSNIAVDLENVTKRDLERHDLDTFEKDLNTINYGLIGIFDRYEEDVINDVIHKFQLQSAFYRDAVIRLMEIFAEGKKIVFMMKDIVNTAAQDNSKTISEAEAIPSRSRRRGC